MKCKISEYVCTWKRPLLCLFHLHRKICSTAVLLNEKSHIKFSLRFVFCWCVKFNALLHSQRCLLLYINITAVFLFVLSAKKIIYFFMFLQLCDTHPTLLAVGQELVFFLGVEDECVRSESNGLSLEGGTFICADEQHLIPLID